MQAFLGKLNSGTAQSNSMAADKTIEAYSLVNVGTTPVNATVSIVRGATVVQITPKNMTIQPNEAFQDRKIVILTGYKIQVQVENGQLDYYFSMP